jgi:hypothetical protein
MAQGEAARLERRNEMIHWVKHSWMEEHSSPEDGPSAHDIDEFEGVTAVEVVNGKASVVLVVGHAEAFVKGEGTIHLHEIEQARKVLHAYEQIRQELSAVQDVMLYAEETMDVVGPMIAAEDLLVRNAAEAMVRHPIESRVTTGCGFALMPTYVCGYACRAVFDMAGGGELIGVVRDDYAVVSDHEDNRRPHRMYAVLDLVQLSISDYEWEFNFDDEKKACETLRANARARSLEETGDAIRAGDLMIERDGIQL